MAAYVPQVPLAQLQQLLDRASTVGGKDQFWTALETELKNFDGFAANYYAQVKQALYAIIKRFSERTPSLNAIHNEAIAMEKTILLFNDLLGTFYRQHFSLAQKLEKLHKGSIEEFERRVLTKSFTNIGFGDFVTMMSDIFFSYNNLRAQEEAAARGLGGQSEAWVPPSAFIRSTRKYWVRLQDLTKLKLEISKHLPVLRFGKKQGVLIDQNPGVQQAGYKAINNDYDGNGEADEAPITSVYFDNDKLRLYHDKIVRKEGATLIRVRWYGKEGSTCFMERKTWHDSWVMNDSIKERFDLKYNEVEPFISGKLKAEQIVDDFMTKKPGKLDDEGLREMLGLAMTIQKRIAKLELKPSVRTVYNRCAFQASDSNKIRISIDTSLHLSAEPDVMPPGRWCYDNTNPVPDHLQFMFPMAVLEIKLSGVDQTPVWLQNIIDSDYVVDAYKFSKFMHSTASLKGFKCSVLPPWFNRPVAHLPGYPLKQWYRMPLELTVNKLSFDEVLKWSESAPTHYPTPQKMGIAADRITGALAPPPNAPPPSKAPPVVGEVEMVPLGKSANFDSKPNTMGGVNSPMLTRPSDVQDNSLLGKFKRLLGMKPDLIIGAGVGEIIPVVPNERLEPKAFFANERTYLSYLKSCIVVALGGFTLAQLQKGATVYVGLSFAILAGLVIFYALFSYHWRRRKIREGNPEVALDDRLGPVLVSLLMIAFLTTLLVIYLVYPPKVHASNQEFDLCIHPSLLAVLVTRDYRIRLINSFYADPTQLSTNLAALTTSMINNLNRTETNRYDVRGQLNLLRDTTTISYYDVPGACTLKGEGLRLIQKTPFNTTSTTLEYRTSDPYAVNNLDLTYPYAPWERYEYIKRRYFFQQARAITKSPSVSVPKVSSLSAFAPIPIPEADGNLAKINDVDLIMTRYGDVQVDFGSLIRKGNVYVYTWFDTMPTLPQFDLSSDIPSDVLFDIVYSRGAFCT